MDIEAVSRHWLQLTAGAEAYLVFAPDIQALEIKPSGADYELRIILQGYVLAVDVPTFEAGQAAAARLREVRP